jgi:hypothetical protein
MFVLLWRTDHAGFVEGMCARGGLLATPVAALAQSADQAQGAAR